MNNAERILSELDSRLNATVDLTLYGRAALSLGFSSPPLEFGQSNDIDAILVAGQAEELLVTTNFWEAQTNHALAGDGLYVSHLFAEDQVVLTPEWKAARVPIGGPWKKLRLSRLGDGDLLLSKLMRDDPHDRSDALFIARRDGLSAGAVDALVNRAVIPDSPELREEFHKAATHLIDALDAK